MGAHLVLLGPSGAGKTSLMLGAAGQGEEFNFTIDRPITYRARRPGEGDSEYEFVERQEFVELRDDLLFTMPSYGNEFGLRKQTPLGEDEVRMRVLLPANARKFRELVQAPTILCAILPIEGTDIVGTLLERNPEIHPAELRDRLTSFGNDLEEAEGSADVVYQNVFGLPDAARGLRNTIEYFLRRKENIDGTWQF